MAEVHEGTVVICGIGGPMGSSNVGPLAELYTLRLADLKSEAQIRERALMKGTPPHPQLGPPNGWVQVDVTNYDQVERAVEGCDAVINITVNRSNRPAAFRVNLGGTWNILRASARHGVKRVITTGPVNVAGMDFEGDPERRSE